MNKGSVKRNSIKAHIESTDQNHTLDISFDLKRTVKADVKHGFDVLRTFFSRLVIESKFSNFVATVFYRNGIVGLNSIKLWTQLSMPA